VNNNALVVTMGADAYGVFAQSTGGGGGVGGTGDSSASAGSGSNSFGGASMASGDPEFAGALLDLNAAAQR